MIPLKVMDAVVGAIGFSSIRTFRDWPDDQIVRLGLAGQIFSNALARKRADIVFREGEERFRLLADMGPVMVWMSGLEKPGSSFSKHWLDLTGRALSTDQQERGCPAGRCAPQSAHGCCEAFDARQPFGGESRRVVDTGVARSGADGTFDGELGSRIDLNDQKQVEEALRARELSLRQAREGLRNLAARLIHAQEEERRRIAREMHDDWTQRLALLGIDIVKLEKHIGRAGDALRCSTRCRNNWCRCPRTYMPFPASFIHPSWTTSAWSRPALECASFSRREGVAVVYHPEEVWNTVPKDVALCVYRVAQEALRNIAKHAAVTKPGLA